MTEKRLRSRAWFDNPANPDMTALYLERYMNWGLSLEELQSGKPISPMLKYPRSDHGKPIRTVCCPNLGSRFLMPDGSAQLEVFLTACTCSGSTLRPTCGATTG